MRDVEIYSYQYSMEQILCIVKWRIYFALNTRSLRPYATTTISCVQLYKYENNWPEGYLNVGRPIRIN